MRKTIKTTIRYAVANLDITTMQPEDAATRLESLDGFDTREAAEAFIERVKRLGVNTDAVRIFECTTTTDIEEV